MATTRLVNIKDLSPKFQDLYAKAVDFVENDCIPAEATYKQQLGQGADRWKVNPIIMEQLKAKARSLGLWNLFLGRDYKEGAGLTNVEYGLIAELTGRSLKIAPEAMNCSAPDTGNSEVLAKYGTEAQKKNGKIRSTFAMTEPKVASSDATNIETSIRRVGNEYVINGHKWWISGAGDPRCAFYLVMGRNANDEKKDKYRQHPLVLVPATTKGIEVVRPMHVMGFDYAPEGHCEMYFRYVRVPIENVILGEGHGSEVIQGRLGPGRIHICMRCIGMAERSLELMIARVTDPSRRTFGKSIAEHGTIVADIAQSRIDIDAARLLVLNAAKKIDEGDAKGVKKEISMAKITCPSMLLKVVNRSMQAHGAAGVSQDFPLVTFFGAGRAMKFADGPDEVHQQQLDKSELKRSEAIVIILEKQKERSADLAAGRCQL